jgi:hypothetical protein
MGRISSIHFANLRRRKMTMTNHNHALTRWAETILATIGLQIDLFEQVDGNGSSLPMLLCVWDGLTRTIRDTGYFHEFMRADLERIMHETHTEGA